MKPYYEEENIQIYCGDCLQIMPELPMVDLVLTSPPYNKNAFRGRRDNSKGKGRWQNSDIVYGEFMDNKDEQIYKQEQIKLLNICFDKIKDTGSILYNHKIRRANSKASHPFEWVGKSNAIFYQEIIWNRLSGVDHNINYLDPITERIYWLVKNTPKCHKDKRWATEIWNIAPLPTNWHPAPFPEKLCKVSILLTTDVNDTVIDPYSGIATTLCACKELGRRGIGIEINKEYCNIAIKRLKNTQKDMF